MDKRKMVDFAINKFFSAFGKNEKERAYILKSSCKAGEKYSNKFVTYRDRYKYSDGYKVIDEVASFNEKCAIIIQGPIREQDNFTLETLKLYKKEYPKLDIIVSTWNDSPTIIINELEKNGGKVIINKKPEKTGLGNVNFQIISTLAGIKYAKTQKCKYVLKTRTDQRIYRMHFIEYFISLLKQFPLESNINKQNERIILGPGLIDGSMFKPFTLSDFMYFGNIEDVELLFSKKIEDTNMTVQEREEWRKSLKGKTKISEFLNITAPELQLIRNFADNVMKRPSELTVESYWEFVKKHLICLGWNDINLYWPKYGMFNESQNDSTANDKDDIITSYCWDFAEWLLLYSGNIKYKKEYEKYSQKIQM